MGRILSNISQLLEPVYHDRSKHIDTRFHFIRQCVQTEAIELEYVNIDEQLADILTKALARKRFLELREKIDLKKVSTYLTKYRGVMVGYKLFFFIIYLFFL